MAPVNLNGVLVPPDPYDARQMVEHLDNNPDEAFFLIWTLKLEQNTLYAPGQTRLIFETPMEQSLAL